MNIVYSSSRFEELETIIDWICDHITITDFTRKLWTPQDSTIIKEFCSVDNDQALFISMKDVDKSLNTIHSINGTNPKPILLHSKNPSLYVSLLPPNGYKEIMYFVKKDHIALTSNNISKYVQYGLTSGNGIDSLLLLMNHVYFKRIKNIENEWPESIQKEFSTQFYRFMSSLTETVSHSHGKTVLYLPPIRKKDIKDNEENNKINNNELILSDTIDKDMLQQVESTVIHWTRQIKEVINNQDNSHDEEGAGPLEEIEFWEHRTIDLSGITNQLNRMEVKEIVDILRIAKSSYLKPFETLSKIIKQGSYEANDNLRFLKKLVPVCKEMEKAELKEVILLLPRLLNLIRLIWTYSRFYNTEDRITSLLRKVSNEIITCCCNKISLKDIFNGNIGTSIINLEKSIECGIFWKKVYYLTVKSISTNHTNGNNRPWSFDETSIFAQVDAFVQRCKDLLEVCEGQIQFARKSIRTSNITTLLTNSSFNPTNQLQLNDNLPCFGGNRGQETVKSLRGIENQFQLYIERLRRLDYDILDVKITHWHGDFNIFKNNIKDLEAMTQNIINGAFDTISTIDAGVDLLLAFQNLAKREAIRRCIDKRTQDIFNIYKNQVNNNRTIFEKNKLNPPLSTTEPQYAGAALWAKSMIRKAEKDLNRLEILDISDLAHNEIEECHIIFESFRIILNDYIQKKYNDWLEDIKSLGAANLIARLDNPLMTKSRGHSNLNTKVNPNETSTLTDSTVTNDQKLLGRSKKGYLECNFDRPLLLLFAEVHYWQFFNGEIQIPYIAHDICNQKEQLRILREHVILVVRDYNRILHELSNTERRLFDDIIRKLDRKIQPGLQKLTWMSKGIVDYYVAECRKHCNETYQIVLEFQQNKDIILKNCKNIASFILIYIERNNIYDEGVFELRQKNHRIDIELKLKEAYEIISHTIESMNHYFKLNNSSMEVHKEWTRFIERTDKYLEDSLRQTVKKSLQELSKAINGDAKTDPHPLFRVHVILEDNKVEFRPLMIHLTQMVNSVAKEIFNVISVVPRLRNLINTTLNTTQLDTTIDENKQKDTIHMDGNNDNNKNSGNELTSNVSNPANPSSPTNTETNNNFYQSIFNDEEILKILVHIMNGMSASATELQKYLAYWDKYKILWNQDKQAFIRRYAKANRPLQQFRVDIERYREQQTNIQSEDLTNTINFIQIDTNLLKTTLIDHTYQWIGKLTGLLNQTAHDELKEYVEMMKENTKKLSTKPTNLEHLGQSIRLLQNIKETASDIEGKFEPLQAKYDLLSEFDVQITDEEIRDLQNLRINWENYEQMMNESNIMLQKCKMSMKQNLQDSVMDLYNYMEDLRIEGQNLLPYSDNYTSFEANNIIIEFEKKMEISRNRKNALKKGLEIFNIEENDNENFKQLEKDLDNLRQIWSFNDEWDTIWSSWKNKIFNELDIDILETTILTFYKKINKLNKDIINKWPICDKLKIKIDQFRQLLPLLQDLKSPALRIRHWSVLKDEMNTEFDPLSNLFNLNQIFSLNFHLHADFISNLSSNANKELSIEKALNTIENHWNTINIQMIEYKFIYYKILSADDLFQALEDDQVQLSSIKASPFYSSFENIIIEWEKSLSLISEVIETLLNVQRCWIYLESIFMASEDIRKQLPIESGLFDDVNKIYCKITENIAKESNALICCKKDNLINELYDMQEKLDKIQKCLDQYLETKRMLFPRFYFLSNDDLLEILGHQKDPDQVQKHIKKCFEGIQSLQLLLPNTRGNTTLEAIEMIAPDGEQIPFAANVVVAGPVEGWLIRIEKQMIITLQKIYITCLNNYRGKKDKWIKEFPGQLLITCGQTAWTNECIKALIDMNKGEKKSLKQLKKKWISYLNRLADMVRGQLSHIDRKKIVALITMEIHSRDVIDRLIKQNCKNINDFEWLMQLRFYYNKESTLNNNNTNNNGSNNNDLINNTNGICEVKQTVSTLEYSYEYQGNNGRLVVTPLTDRCILTMTTALHLNRGGNPLGPAGTGKTETVKDLGKNLAKYVIVFNCSDGLDYKSVGRMFSGLVQSGGWGCFDEFNRIEIEVLSVVAQQVLTIMQAIQQKKKGLLFLNTMIKCNPNMGIFITMNPGYAGRSELPDNLKALMRPCAMMVPDLSLITEVMLQAEGFRDAKMLAKKTTTLYSLMTQQLSKQDHYDFGLRSLKAVLNMAGSLKRQNIDSTDIHEEHILLRALRDMNIPKFIYEDVILFKLLLNDLFPSIELSPVDYNILQDALEKSLLQDHLQKHSMIIFKAIQLYESQITRHCNMIVGQTMAGKSTVWKLLANAKTLLSKNNKTNNNNNNNNIFNSVKYQVLNPKSISLNEIYGVYDKNTSEWVDGILSSIFRNFASLDNNIDNSNNNNTNNKEEKWIILDGPVDTLWIESMNSVMDDNKVLTLINGDRISMTSNMSLLFEVQDLSVASPATVSRAGMIYMDVQDLGWKVYVKTWLELYFTDIEDQKNINILFDKYIDKLLRFKKDNIHDTIYISDFNCIKSLCNLFYTIIINEKNNLNENGPISNHLLEKWFLFSIVWSIMGGCNKEDRKKMDLYLRDIDTIYPPVQTVYEFYVETKTKDYRLWEEKLNPSFRIGPNTPFYNIIVTTVDTLRYGYLIQTLIKAGINTLIVGNSGVGKTTIIQKELEILSDNFNRLFINFSSATASNTTQEIIESVMEKRSLNRYGPVGSKKLITFIDDLNMPCKDSFGSQPAIELLRQYIDYGYWYDRKKQFIRHILDMQLIGAMCPPGGGRSVLSGRFQSKFHLINIIMPSQNQLCKVFETMIIPKFSMEFDDEIKPLGSHIVLSTILLYHLIEEYFLPTPKKCHYLFNLRDMAKVIQGLLNADKSGFSSRDSLLRLWVHENSRVYSDRFIIKEDKNKFKSMIDELLATHFQTDWNRLFYSVPENIKEKAIGSLFVSNLITNTTNSTTNNNNNNEVSLQVREIHDLHHYKKIAEESLENYNAEIGAITMDLVMFGDALLHLLRIIRVLSMPRGNLLLVGVGGSGRQSLTRLACFITNYKLFQIEITKNYRDMEFHEDIKMLLNMTGIQGKSYVFLFSDSQIKSPIFLEDISNLLSTGEVPNLYEKDEQIAILDSIRPKAKALGIPENKDSLWNLFINESRKNLHIVLAMSPIGEGFRNRCRKFPSLINCTTIDWFDEWPLDALQEVGIHFLEQKNISIIDNTIRNKIASVFAVAHTSVIQASSQMLVTMKRHNYVTPTNYLALVKNYVELIIEKMKMIKDTRDKLINGLSKLEESRNQVEKMSKQLEERKIIVSQKNKDCSDLLVIIISERRVADEQKKQVEADSERISKEEIETKKIAEEAQKDLDDALPALQQAMSEVDNLDKTAIAEVKVYSKPPEIVSLVMCAVMILFNLSPTWAAAKIKMNDVNFLQQIKMFDKDGIRDKTLVALKKYTCKPNFNPDMVRKVSSAAGALCSWVLAMEVYSNVYRMVSPKREALKRSQEALVIKQSALVKAKEKLNIIIEKVDHLKKQYDESVNEKNALREEAELLEIKLIRAEQLVSGLSGERERWQKSITEKNNNLINVVGDALVASAFLSYAGPFDTKYRSSLVDTWMNRVLQQHIPLSNNFKFTDFLCDPIDLRKWKSQGLPQDTLSAENGVITMRGKRWPLMIDPQNQANKWIKYMEKDNKLEIIDLLMKDFIRKLENSIRFGIPVLIQDIQEELDPILEPILNKSIIKIGNKEIIKLGDKELDYNRDFRLYFTTKLHNPHYTPEVSTKTTIINFVVKEEGLQAQLLGIVVQMEEPLLEHQKSELVLKVASAKNKLIDLENEILRLLSTVKGSLLDDESLVNTLNASKVTSEEVSSQLVISEETEKKIDIARMAYISVALRSSTLYFILNDMTSIDIMYQFSLDSYIDLFKNSIIKSRHNKQQITLTEEINDRMNSINDYHTFSVYTYACRGLFERHKLLFSFQMCIRIMQSLDKIPIEEYHFLLKGTSNMVNKENKGIKDDFNRIQISSSSTSSSSSSLQKINNPCNDFLDGQLWENIIQLNNLQRFHGLITSFEQSTRLWKIWFQSASPEVEPLPGDWESKCNYLQRMLLLRCIRPDRVTIQATRFVSSNLGPQYIEPPAFDLKSIYHTSTYKTPLIFILSPGVDPTSHLLALADTLHKTVDSCALGQGQASIAEEMFHKGLVNGNWIFLANCHLMLSWAPILEKLIDNIGNINNTNNNTEFRLWLSSDPNPKFPISILQKSIKMTTEPPRGIKANLLRLYNTITPEQFTRCKNSNKYKCLLFCLCWFHSLLLERKKFNNLGWNIPYDFNESDFLISEDVLAIYLDEYEETPWDALKYLIAQANYGGRVTDDWDRKLMLAYINQFFSDNVFNTNRMMLADHSEEYYIPSDGILSTYIDYINHLPTEDPPAAFGQHSNAQIASQIDNGKELLSTALSLQPKDLHIDNEQSSNDEKVINLMNVLKETIPLPLDLNEIKNNLSTRTDPDPLKTVLIQETERYNKLLSCIHDSLILLEKGIKGLILITSELEAIYNGVLINKVPDAWNFCYPSLKPLSSWTKDLKQRIQQITNWGLHNLPICFWLAGFTYPTGFLTALLQTCARKNGMSIDSFNWEFGIINQHEDTLINGPKDGAYIKGLFLEGARWDFDQDCLTEPYPMELTCSMPIIHFKPVENRKKTIKGTYACPLYMYPIRTGTRERPSYMITVDLKCGPPPKSPEVWIKRGTALLLSLGT